MRLGSRPFPVVERTWGDWEMQTCAVLVVIRAFNFRIILPISSQFVGICFPSAHLPWTSNRVVFASIPPIFFTTHVKFPLSKGWCTFQIVSSVPEPFQISLYFASSPWIRHVVFRCTASQPPTWTPSLNHSTSKSSSASTASQRILAVWEAFAKIFGSKLLITGGLTSR